MYISVSYTHLDVYKRQENDIEIGEVKSNGKVEYYEGESKEKYTKSKEKDEMCIRDRLLSDQTFLNIKCHQLECLLFLNYI